MLYNFDWLKESKRFPPVSEIPRLKGYSDNANLFDDEPTVSLKPYLDRLTAIISGLKDIDKVNYSFISMPNYWQLSTIKTVDLMVGDEPNIICDKVKDELISVLQRSNFSAKLDELVIDNDSLGECLVRPYIDRQGNRNFVSQSPSMWFPICNPENIKEIITDVLCWTVCTYQDASHPAKNKYELYCKIQQRGSDKIEIRRYAVPKTEYVENYTNKTTNEAFGPWTFFIIGKLLEVKIEDAPFSQLVINIPGTTTSRSLHGVSNYDRITPIVAEIAVRESLAHFILDQNSAPRMAAPESAFTQNKEGRWVLKTGGRNFVIAPNQQPPIYVTWDGNLQANEQRINDLKKELFSMCEVGPVINQDEMNSSQGYEALNVKLTNAKLKVRRLAKAFRGPLKTLIAFLLDKTNVVDEDINIIFNEGIPVSEFQNITTAQAKKNLGVSLHSVLKEYFGLTDEQATAEVEKAKEENANSFIDMFGGSRNFDFDPNNHPKDDGTGDGKTVVKGGTETLPDKDKDGADAGNGAGTGEE